MMWVSPSFSGRCAQTRRKNGKSDWSGDPGAKLNARLRSVSLRDPRRKKAGFYHVGRFFLENDALWRRVSQEVSPKHKVCETFFVL